MIGKLNERKGKIESFDGIFNGVNAALSHHHSMSSSSRRTGGKDAGLFWKSIAFVKSLTILLSLSKVESRSRAFRLT